MHLKKWNATAGMTTHLHHADFVDNEHFEHLPLALGLFVKHFTEIICCARYLS
jgi:hypothetical protein